MAGATQNDEQQGYPHNFGADETRQAAQMVGNDNLLDVNMNAVVVRAQTLTFTVLGNGFVAAQERRQILADQAIAKNA